MIYPLGKVFYLSFQHYNPTKPFTNGFAGLDNFITIFTKKEFYNALGVSAKFVACEVVLQLIFGMIVALILNQKFKGRGFFRALTFIPWALSGVLTAVLWSIMFNQHFGVLGDLLAKLGIIKEPIAWLANTKFVLGSVIVAELWRGIPFFAISLLAAMQGLPDDIYEAARVDGSTKFQMFRFITLPMLKNTIVLTTLLRTIWEFNSVDLIYSLTGGGPVGKTTTLSMLIANQAIKTSNYGYGSALSVVSFAILAVIAVIYMKLSGFGKEEA
ncbi:carbohydrate ABC transporter permease [Hungatella hathewayi]|uniref:carbohydrate ABC transporter permease n=1 Tax=Hungatella hathewayi TaxID=154046 RepID=UPI00356B379C